MNHADLVQRAGRWLKGTHRCEVVLLEPYVCSALVRECPDAYGIGSKGSIVVECKVSVSDFTGDKRKSFRHAPELGMGRHRWYLTPRGLLTQECFLRHAPAGWGWAEAVGTKRINVLRRPTPFDATHHSEAMLLRSHFALYGKAEMKEVA